MCWLCDNPEADQQDYFNVLRAKVLTRGWTVQYVEDDRTPFAYTIGLHDFGAPELLVTGVSPPRALRLFNYVVPDILRRDVPAPGQRIALPAGPLVEIVEVDHPEVHMGWAVAFGDPELRALQLVWADGRQRWPWTPDFADGRSRQPVLGLRRRVA